MIALATPGREHCRKIPFPALHAHQEKDPDRNPCVATDRHDSDLLHEPAPQFLQDQVEEPQYRQMLKLLDHHDR